MRVEGGGGRKWWFRGFPHRALGGVLLAGRAIHPFHRHFWTVCHVLGIILGTGDIMVNGVVLFSPLTELMF